MQSPGPFTYTPESVLRILCEKNSFVRECRARTILWNITSQALTNAMLALAPPDPKWRNVLAWDLAALKEAPPIWTAICVYYPDINKIQQI